MKKTKVLFVMQEIMPYVEESYMAEIGRYLPQGIQEKGREIRTFMPRYGCVNERRNQLHEVIRLSGMNLIISDTDHPLIIKVASIQMARMQVYFIDNEDYFQDKYKFRDENNNFLGDNDEKAIFFARGVLETVKKLNWQPDIIHCHGWLTALVPMYIKKSLKDNPIFTESRVIYSAYNDDIKETLNKDFSKKVAFEDGIVEADVKRLATPSIVNLNKFAIDHSDAVIFGSPDLDDKLKTYINASGKPKLDYYSQDSYIDTYSEFYDEVLVDESILC